VWCVRPLLRTSDPFARAWQGHFAEPRSCSRALHPLTFLSCTVLAPLLPISNIGSSTPCTLHPLSASVSIIPALPNPVSCVQVAAAGPNIGTALTLPVLFDITPATVADLLGVVSCPAALSDAALQLKALRTLATLLSGEGFPETVTRMRCIAAGACVEWLHNVMEAHGCRLDVVQWTTFVFRRIVWAAPGKLRLIKVVPLLQTALERHRDNTEVAIHCIACFASLAAHADNRLRLMEVLPLLRMALERHPDTADVAVYYSSFFQNLALHADNQVGLMEVVPLLRTALEHHPDDPEVTLTIVSCFGLMTMVQSGKVFEDFFRAAVVALNACDGYARFESEQVHGCGGDRVGIRALARRRGT
jgi:hypothetical protein